MQNETQQRPKCKIFCASLAVLERVLLIHLAEINPQYNLVKDEAAPFLEMAKLPVIGGKIATWDQKEFKGSGSRFQNGDTLFARITPCTENGKIGFVDFLCDTQTAFGSTEFTVLSPKNGTHPEFIYYLCSSNHVRVPAIEFMIGSTGRQRVPNWVFKNITVPRFSFAEQRRIAEILTSVDDSIRATELVIEQAECVKRGLMEDLLTGGLGDEAVLCDELSEGWSFKELKEICSIRGEYGANAPKSDYDPSLPRYVRITDIDARGNLQEATAVSIPHEKAASYILDEGDIVIARSGATVGKSYIHTADNGECAFAGYLVRFRLRPEIASHDWLKYVFQSKPYWDWVRDNQRAGAQPNINAKEYGSYLLKVPPLVEQQRIAKILGSIDKQISQNRRVVAQLQRLKRGLMDDLLTGRVRTVS